jgi:hypothetical protein
VALADGLEKQATSLIMKEEKKPKEKRFLGKRSFQQSLVHNVSETEPFWCNWKSEQKCENFEKPTDSHIQSKLKARRAAKLQSHKQINSKPLIKG